MKWNTWQKIAIIDGVITMAGGIGLLICAILQSQSFPDIDMMIHYYSYAVICFGVVMSGIIFLFVWQTVNPHGI